MKVLLILLLTLLNACGDVNSQNSGRDGEKLTLDQTPIFTPADIALPDTTDTSYMVGPKDEILSHLVESALVGEWAKRVGLTRPVERQESMCDFDPVGMSEPVHRENLVIRRISLEKENCITEDSAFLGLKASYLFILNCEGGVLVDTGNMEYSCQTGKGTLLSQFEYSYESIVPNSHGVDVTVPHLYRRSIMAKDGGACAFVQDGDRKDLADGCLDLSQFETEREGVTEKQQTQYGTKGVTFFADLPTAGALDAYILGWRGSIEFKPRTAHYDLRASGDTLIGELSLP